jgi:hypothetical protein
MKALHNTYNTERRAGQTFASWCQTAAPHALNLDPDIVDVICRLMRRPEMHGINGIALLQKTLLLNRTKLIFTTDREWHSVTLSARVLWQAYLKRGKL